VQQKITQAEGDIGQLQETIEQTADETGRSDRLVEELKIGVQVLTVEKQRNLASLLRLQRSGKRYEEVASGSGSHVASAASARASIQEQMLAKNKVVDMIKVLHDAYPQLELLWTEFYKWLGVTMG